MLAFLKADWMILQALLIYFLQLFFFLLPQSQQINNLPLFFLVSSGINCVLPQNFQEFAVVLVNNYNHRLLYRYPNLIKFMLLIAVDIYVVFNVKAYMSRKKKVHRPHFLFGKLQ